MDYLGLALATNGTPLADRPVTLKRSDTLATLASTVTDANGLWRFDDISPANIVRAEISAGTTPQIAVKSVFSGDAYSLYIREKLTAAPAAIFNLPPLANLYSNGVLLTTALDGRYVNITGDTLTGVLTVPFLQATDALINNNLEVSGTSQLDDTYVSNLFVGADANIPGTLTVDTIVSTGTGSIEAGSGGFATTGNVYGVGFGTFDGGLDVAGGAFQVAPGTGAVEASGLLSAHARILVDGGTLGAPEVASISDPNTGIVWSGSDILQLSANGQEIARAWMNGATTQFASYATQTYIANQLLLGGTQAATGVMGLVRVLQVRDGSGNTLGWIPIYGALN